MILHPDLCDNKSLDLLFNIKWLLPTLSLLFSKWKEYNLWTPFVWFTVVLSPWLSSCSRRPEPLLKFCVRASEATWSTEENGRLLGNDTFVNAATTLVSFTGPSCSWPLCFAHYFTIGCLVQSLTLRLRPTTSTCEAPESLARKERGGRCLVMGYRKNPNLAYLLWPSGLIIHCNVLYSSPGLVIQFSLSSLLLYEKGSRSIAGLSEPPLSFSKILTCSRFNFTLQAALTLLITQKAKKVISFVPLHHQKNK